MKANGIWWDSWGFKYQILWNPMESDGIHEVLSIKSYEIQWKLMGSMRFYNPNLIKSNGILWWSNWLKPYPNFYASELLIIKGCLRGGTYKEEFWPIGVGLLIRCWHYIIYIIFYICYILYYILYNLNINIILYHIILYYIISYYIILYINIYYYILYFIIFYFFYICIIL